MISYEALRTVLTMSITGGVIAAILFALKPLIRNRLPKTVQYYLWLVVLVALLVPISRLVVLPDTAPNIPAISKTVDWYVADNRVIHDRVTAYQRIDANGFIGIPESSIAEVEAIVPEPWIPEAIDWFRLIHSLGVIGYFAFAVCSYAAFTSRMKRRSTAASPDEIALLAELCGERAIGNRPYIYRNPLAATPMLIGLFRPAVILPDKEYSGTQLRCVLLHELTHLRRKDVLVKWLSVIAAAVHWFNPIVWLVRREIDRACELACDEAVIRNLDTGGKQIYGETLLYVAADSKTPHAVLSTTMCEEKKALKERLGAIMKSKKHTRLAIILSAVLMLAVGSTAIALGAGRAAKTDPPTATISHNGRSAIITLGDKAQIPYVELGSAISINFGDARPSSISVIEVIANADGSRKYAEETDKILDVELSGSNLATFRIERNAGDMLSSHSDDYLSGNAWRWYRIICNDDGRSVTEYGLWVRTDPYPTIEDIPLDQTGFVPPGEYTQAPKPLMSTWQPLGDLPADYSTEKAIADSIVVITYDEIYNRHQADLFYEDAASGGGSAFMRVMQFTREGDAIITDYQYDGEVFTVTHDNTRDNFAAPSDRMIQSFLFQYLVPHVIPGSGTLSYYLSNSQDISNSDGYGVIDDVWLVPPPSGTVMQDE